MNCEFLKERLDVLCWTNIPVFCLRRQYHRYGKLAGTVSHSLSRGWEEQAAGLEAQPNSLYFRALETAADFE
jgi:hypothetical protein